MIEKRIPLSLFALALLGTATIGIASMYGRADAASARSQEEDDDDETGIELKDLPEQVRATARTYFGKAEPQHASKEKIGDATAYEVEGKAEGGLGLAIRILANGQIDEVEREVTAEKLPPGALANIQAGFPGAHATRVEAVEVHYFEVELTGKDGKKAHVVVGPSGKVQSEEEEEEGEEGEEGEENGKR